MRISTSLLTALVTAASLTTASPAYLSGGRDPNHNNSPLPRGVESESPLDSPIIRAIIVGPKPSIKDLRYMPGSELFALSHFADAQKTGDPVQMCKAAAWLLSAMQNHDYPAATLQAWRTTGCERRYGPNSESSASDPEEGLERRGTDSSGSSATGLVVDSKVKAAALEMSPRENGENASDLQGDACKEYFDVCFNSDAQGTSFCNELAVGCETMQGLISPSNQEEHQVVLLR